MTETNMNSPLVTVITPIFNCGKFLSKTIKSVQAQSFIAWEMILVDDCSSDDSAEIADRFAQNDSRIRVIRLPENIGPAHARNEGIKAARGHYIAFLDSDDLWLPNKLQIQLDFMTTEDVVFCFCQVERFSEKDRKLGISIVPDRIDYKGLLKSNVVVCSSAMYDTRKLGKIMMPDIRKRQDYGLWLRILKQTDFGYGLKHVLVQYRVREGSVSANKRVAAAYTWKIYRDIEKLSFPVALYYFCYYAVSGVLRIKWPGLAKRLGLLQ